MCSFKLYLVTFCAALSLCWTQTAEDELSVTYKFIRLNYSVVSNEKHSENEVCREELLSNMTKKFLIYMDQTVDPCDNFYKYACGNYGKFHPLSNENHISQVYDALEKRLSKAAAEFLNQPLRENYDLNDAETKARVFYKSCTDIDTIRQRGVQPLKEFIASLGGWAVVDHTLSESHFDLFKVLGKLVHINLYILLGVEVHFSPGADVKDVVKLLSGDTLLSTKNCTNSSQITGLKKLFQDVLITSGVPSDIANETSEDLLKFEVEITKLQFDPLSTQRGQNLTLGELKSQIPGIDWSELLREVFGQTLTAEQKVYLSDREYFQGLSKLLQVTPIKTLANYVFMKSLIHLAPNIDAGFKNIQSDFKIFAEPFPDEKFCEKVTIYFFSDVLNRYLAKNYFKNSPKTEVANLMEKLRRSFAKTIEENSWLDSETKAINQKLLNEMVLHIGHPEMKLSKRDMNKEYSDLNVIPGKFFESFLNIQERGNLREFKLLNKAPNSYLDMGPIEIGAIYDRIKNEAMMPMIMLQPPFYHTLFPKAINFGAMGSILGHEIAHAFDNNGTWTDMHVTAFSNWPIQTREKFDELAECFVHQFNSYCKNNMSTNGNTTRKENIADTTGTSMAFRAYLEELSQNPSEENLSLPKLNMTDKQLFFLSFAHIWCSAVSETSMMYLFRQGSHSPSEFRVIGTLSNSKEFAEAFSCPVGSKMNPSNKCVIW